MRFLVQCSRHTGVLSYIGLPYKKFQYLTRFHLICEHASNKEHENV